MTDMLAVKVSAAAPSGATAVGEFAFSDRLGRIPGVRRAAAERQGFTGAPGSTLVLTEGEQVRVVAGLGPSAGADEDAVRRAVAAFVRCVSSHRRVALGLPELDLDEDRSVAVVAEAAMLANYAFTDLKSADDAGPKLSTVTLVHDGDLRAARAAVAEAAVVADAVCFARDLVNTPGGELTAPRFAEIAAERAEAAGLEVEVLDADAIAAARLGGLLAVNKGSVHPPRLVKLTHTPEGADDATPTVVFVGKGLTFDSGGLSLKIGEAMYDMKMDMAGAAAVIAAMCALPALEVSVRVVSYTPMTDNMTGADAQRPGDVYTARNGTTVEVLNTDAEGRLVLGEALVLAAEEEPAGIVDLATLTGACMVALGQKVAGLMGNDDGFRDAVAEAADRAGERVWPLPLPADYRKQLDSEVADLKNIGSRYGGALTAGLFLSEFVPAEVPWAHLDIAGPAWGPEVDGVSPKGGTGFGVRTLVELVRGWVAGESDGATEDTGDQDGS